MAKYLDDGGSAPLPTTPAKIDPEIQTIIDKIASTAPTITDNITVIEDTPYSSLTLAERQAMSQEEKLAAIKAEREARMANAAAERAASDPKYDIMNRPDAPPSDSEYIYYYGWIGGVGSGEWKLYRAPNTESNQVSYGSRSIGGVTQASFSSTSGANALVVQPKPIRDADGNIVGWDQTGSGNTLNGGIGGNGNAGGVNGGNGGNGGNTGGNGNGVTGTTGTTGTGAPSTNISILKALLVGQGFNSKIIDASVNYLDQLLKDGLDYDNATEIFLHSKEYTLKNGTKLTSPFYTEYGYLNEGLVNPKKPDELYNAVEGYKGVVDKYSLSTKYLTQDALKSYVKNNVTVADLDERANTARLKALNADPSQVTAMIKLGFIGSAADLTDFYLDPKIGKEQLELNKNTGAFVAEAIRRAQSGIGSSAADLERYKKITAGLTAKDLTEAQIAQLAGEGFQTIGEQLLPTTTLSQIYEKTGGTAESNAALQTQIQSELENEQYLNLASERRKKLAGQNAAAFQGSSGLYSRYGVATSLTGPGTSGLI